MPRDVQVYTETVFDQETFTKTAWQSAMFSSKLYQRSANSDTFFMPSAIHQYNLTCPLALKGNHTWVKNLYAAQFSSGWFTKIQYDPAPFYCLLFHCILILLYNSINIMRLRSLWKLQTTIQSSSVCPGLCTAYVLEIFPLVVVQAYDLNLIKPVH